MANPARIREALIKMLSDKKSNTRAQEEFQAQQRGGFEDRADADLADMTKGRLQDSRREAQRIQPSDPLAPNPQNPLGRSETQVVRSGGGAPLTVRGPSGQLPGGADNPRLGAENRFSSSFDDDFGPMSRDLDTFPDDALSDPAEAAFSRKFEADRLNKPGGPGEFTEEMFNTEMAQIRSGKLQIDDAHPMVQEAMLLEMRTPGLDDIPF